MYGLNNFCQIEFFLSDHLCNSTTMRIRNAFITPESYVFCRVPAHSLELFLVFCMVYCFPGCHVKGIRQVCRLLFLASFMSVVACIIIYLFLLLGSSLLCGITYSPITRHFLGCFQCSSVMNKAMTICLQDLVWMLIFISLGKIPSNRIAGSDELCAFNSAKNLLKCGTILHFHQQCNTVLVLCFQYLMLVF